MNRMRFLKLGAVVAVAFLVVACAKPPVEDQNATRAALDTARPAAEKWAPNEWRTAQQTFDDANKEIETQNNRFALMRNYDKAKQMLNDAKTAADSAVTAAEANKAQAKTEAEQKLATAETAINDARTALGTVPKTKDTKADIELFTSDLDGLATSLNDAKGMMASESYREASQKADTIMAQANDIKTKLEEAAAKLAGKRGGR